MSGQVQQFSGVAPEDQRVIGLAEPAEAGDDLDGTIVPHVEAEIAAEYDAVGAHRVDEVAEGARVVADRVVAEAPEVGRDGAARRLPRFRANPLTVLETPDQIGKGAAGVREADLKARQTVQDAPEH